MTLYEFLKDKNNVFWDFTNDCDCVAYQEIEDVVEKYFVYKSVVQYKAVKGVEVPAYKKAVGEFADKNFEKYKGVKDPDKNSPLLQEIYKILWEDICNKEWMKGNDRKTIQADTMTSVQTTLNSVIKEKEIETDEEKQIRGSNYISLIYCIYLYVVAENEFKNEFQNQLCEVKENTINQWLNGDGAFENHLSKLKETYQSIYLKGENNFGRRLRKVKGLELFLSMYHTIGNFIPTPRGFNGARSGGGKHDYWDLTLLKIKDWYFTEDEEKREEILVKLLHGNKEAKENCKKWLQHYGEGGSKKKGWKKFIDSNYLQDFVKGDDYKPISFCENHDWNNIKVDDYVEFFMTVSSLIYLRGKRLLEALEEKLNN